MTQWRSEVRYHYTVGKYVTEILRVGIKPATAFVPKSERPIVWFTSSEQWEGTANKGIVGHGVNRTLTRDETERMCGGLYRIGVRDDMLGLHPFQRITNESRQHPAVTDSLVSIAIEAGSNPDRDWFGTFHTVDPVEFAAVERWDGTNWQETREERKAAGAMAGLAWRKRRWQVNTVGVKTTELTSPTQ
jgi:hypothetical protein